MSNNIHHQQCPVCASSEIEQIFSAIDNTVSGKQFYIVECKICQLQFTQDAPGELAIADYYKSSNYISHTNSNKGFVNKLYQWVRNITIGNKKYLIKKITKQKKGVLLDMGCGTGFFAASMKNSGWDVTGIEPDSETRKLALSLNKIELFSTDIFYELPEKRFDVITLWHVLEHVHSLKSTIVQLHKLLKENGKLIIAVPNRNCYDAEFYQAHWAAYDVPRHLYHFNFQSMKAMMEKENFKLKEIKPMWFDSFYISLLSSKIKFGEIKWISAIIVALCSNLQTLKNSKRCSSIIYIFSKSTIG